MEKGRVVVREERVKRMGVEKKREDGGAEETQRGSIHHFLRWNCKIHRKSCIIIISMHTLWYLLCGVFGLFILPILRCNLFPFALSV